MLRYLFSTDHKTIGVQYGVTSLLFLLVGFALVLIVRWQHAYSGYPLPLIGAWLGDVAPAASCRRSCTTSSARCTCRAWIGWPAPASSCRPASSSAARPWWRPAGGNALLWQHLFWFLAHPEVYVLVVTRRPRTTSRRSIG